MPRAERLKECPALTPGLSPLSRASLGQSSHLTSLFVPCLEPGEAGWEGGKLGAGRGLCVVLGGSWQRAHGPSSPSPHRLPSARQRGPREHNAGLLLLLSFRVCSAAVEFDC